MTPLEMYQEFRVYVDKIDSQDIPEIYPEQVFIFLNNSVDEYVQALRTTFEVTGKIADDGSNLVKRLFIKGDIVEDRVEFDYNKASLVRNTVDYIPVYYLMNGRIESSYIRNPDNSDSIISGLSDITYVQQDDIIPALGDPFNKPKYYNTVPCVKEYPGLIATPPPTLTLNQLVGTFIVKPSIISQTVTCNLKEQLHKTIVKRAVEIALENVESIRQKTFNN